VLGYVHDDARRQDAADTIQHFVNKAQLDNAGLLAVYSRKLMVFIV
jgi:hypothetical protein